jgi:hypothetical protein
MGCILRMCKYHLFIDEKIVTVVTGVKEDIYIYIYIYVRVRVRERERERGREGERERERGRE